jgi:hypothetical protein
MLMGSVCHRVIQILFSTFFTRCQRKEKHLETHNVVAILPVRKQEARKPPPS